MWGAVLARSARRPLIAHEHTFEGRPSKRRTWGYRYLIAPSARRIICVSNPVASSLIAEGVSPRLLEVVPNGVPTTGILDRSAARAELGVDAARSVIGMVGRLRREKRHDLAIQALALLRNEGVDVMLCCVGDGPELAPLRAVADGLGVGDHVRWTGEVSNAGRLARAFDAAVLCSDYEGMPLAALEVMVAGVPLVATAVGSLPELLAEGGGITVPPGDAQALATALATVLVDRDPAERLATAQRARDLFGLDRVADDVQRVYDEVLACGHH
jgi:glycosyltransferase involved in cell wall biosynthesis